MPFDDFPCYLIRLVNGDTFICRTNDEDERYESELLGHYILCLRPTVVKTISGLPEYEFSRYEPAGKHQQNPLDTRLQIPISSILYLMSPNEQLEHDYTKYVEAEIEKKYGR